MRSHASIINPQIFSFLSFSSSRKQNYLTQTWKVTETWVATAWVHTAEGCRVVDTLLWAWVPCQWEEEVPCQWEEEVTADPLKVVVVVVVVVVFATTSKRANVPEETAADSPTEEEEEEEEQAVVVVVAEEEEVLVTSAQETGCAAVACTILLAEASASSVKLQVEMEEEVVAEIEVDPFLVIVEIVEADVPAVAPETEATGTYLILTKKGLLLYMVGTCVHIEWSIVKL